MGLGIGMRHKTIKVVTKKHTDFVDITAEAKALVSESGARDGILSIYSMHTTAGIVINENELSLLQDMEYTLNKMVPRGIEYKHGGIEGNAHSHLRTILWGESKSVPIIDGKLQLGTWQRIFLAEFDGPRTRRILMVIV
jgi:secondary thiamine-phosphate synthase enzyme